MRRIPLCLLFTLAALTVTASRAAGAVLDVSGTACETLLPSESKASARIRAADRATFSGIKKLEVLASAEQTLQDHDLNILIYQLVDEYIEDLSVHNLPQENDDKVCVDINGRLSEETVKDVVDRYMAEKSTHREASAAEVEQVAQEVDNSIAIKPDDLHNLALLHIANLEFFDGTVSAKLTEPLQNMYTENPYFYLTDDAEIADYVIYPKVLKAKVDQLDAGHNRLHMVVVLDTGGLDGHIAGEYQNRFVLFGTEEDPQKIAVRMLKKLLDQAGRSLLGKIEQNEQRRLERNAVGRDLAS